MRNINNWCFFVEQINLKILCNVFLVSIKISDVI